MKLDPSKCQPGTKGYLPAGNVYDYEGHGEGESVFDAFKEPDVVLTTDHQWQVIGGNVLADSEAVEVSVFATWQEAVRYTIEQDRESFEAIIKEAQVDLAQVAKVEQWLNESESK